MVLASTVARARCILLERSGWIDALSQVYHKFVSTSLAPEVWQHVDNLESLKPDCPFRGNVA
jgi:hypothetical protein